jgi:hypothetical protein
MRLAAIVTLILATYLAPEGRLWKAFQAHVRLSSTEVSSLDNGEIVSKVLPSANSREMAAFGMISVDASADTLVTRFQDITNFKKAEQVLEIGKFSTPPTLQDLRTLTLDAEDIEAIKTCEVRRCGLKLSTEMIARLQRGIRAGDPAALFRQVLLEYVQSYLSTGNTALVKYADKAGTTSVAREFQELLAASSYLRDYSPEFFNYLQSFPREKPQDVEDFLYWSKEKFGLKPVISITHVSIHRPARADEVVIVSKQIYASHYFDASAGVTALVANGSGRGPRSYLMYLNRSRIDALGGTFSGVISSVIRRQIQDGLTTNLKLAKQRLERP